MRRLRLLGITWLVLFSAGCSFCHYGLRNLVTVPLDALERRHIKKENRRLAKQAWRRILRCNPDSGYSKEYAEGFIDGFEDYLNCGGAGMPPPIPPWRYRKHKYQTLDGRAAVEDWFAGFSLGAANAHASGIRELRVVPTTAPGLPDDYPAFHHGRRSLIMPAPGTVVPTTKGVHQ